MVMVILNHEHLLLFRNSSTNFARNGPQYVYTPSVDFSSSAVIITRHTKRGPPGSIPLGGFGLDRPCQIAAHGEERPAVGCHQWIVADGIHRLAHQ